MSITKSLTRELYGHHDIDPAAARRHLEDARDVSATYAAARIYGNDEPRPPMKFFYDESLRKTGTLAWYLDPQEVKREYPLEGIRLEQEIGPHPIVAYNPDVVNFKNKGYVRAIDAHEKTHGGQPGKLLLKRIGARTSYGDIPLGLMLIEGGVEWALERRGVKPPTRYMDEFSDRKQNYSIYRDFVHEIESQKPGIMRQVYTAAKRGGANAIIRLIETIPEIDEKLERYAKQLNTPRAYGKAA